PWPTVLCIHGGPHYAYGDAFSIDFELLAGAGLAVLFHNYRGSAGYGAELAARLHGEWGSDALDHHAALDAALAAGIADPERLGVYGASYGGYAACSLLCDSPRFRAGVAENPIVDPALTHRLGDVESWI